jgi:transposase-like protein
MAGRPMKRKVLAELEKRGGKQYFQEYILSGGTISKLAKELDVSRGYLHTLLTKHDVYSTALDEVREQAADAHAEAGFEVMKRLRADRKLERDQADPGSKQAEISAIDVAIAKEEVAVHKFIAQSWNKNRYGSTANQTQVTLSVGDMHLDALRKMKVVNDSTKAIEND